MMNTVHTQIIQPTVFLLPGIEMTQPYYVTGFIEERGQRLPFSLKIEGPFATSENKDFYCRVESPELLGKEFNVYGHSARQTKELALQFVEVCLKDKKAYDAEGNTLVLKPWE